MKNAQAELIILLTGNHLPIVIPAEAVQEWDAKLEKLLGDAQACKGWLTFKDAEGLWPRRVHPHAVVGWYFRPKVEPTSQKALAIMERMEKKMPDPGEGDDWKNS